MDNMVVLCLVAYSSVWGGFNFTTCANVMCVATRSSQPLISQIGYMLVMQSFLPFKALTCWLALD